ncbi:MAG: glutaredoxin family protein, partial [Anaerolineae bacterium]
MRTVRLYSKEDCHLCDDARMILDAVATRVPFQVQVVDIEQDPVLRKLFSEHVPVVDFGDGTRLYWPFSPEDLFQALNGALELPQGTVVDKQVPRATVSGRTRDLV